MTPEDLVRRAARRRGVDEEVTASALAALARRQAAAGKVCAHCRRARALDDFGVDVSRRDGLNPTCRECRTGLRQGHARYSPGPLLN